MSDTKPELLHARDLPIGVCVGLILCAPACLVMWVVLLAPYMLWVTCSVVLSTITGRNWTLVVGELPRLTR